MALEAWQLMAQCGVMNSQIMYRSIEDVIGKTPLVALQRLGATENAKRGNVILGKLEGNNPAGVMAREKQVQLCDGECFSQHHGDGHKNQQVPRLVDRQQLHVMCHVHRFLQLKIARPVRAKKVYAAMKGLGGLNC